MKQSKQSGPTSWKNTFGNAIAAGAVAGIAGVFGIQWGVGVLVFFSLLVFPGLVKPFSRKLVAIATALVVAVAVKNLVEVLMQGAFQ